MDAIDVRDRDLRPVDHFDLSEPYRREIEGVLISRAEIEKRVAELGTAISEDYHSNGDFYPICVLKGAMRFHVDLLRNIDLGVPYSEGIVHTSRYRAGPTTDTPDVNFFDEDILAGKDVLLIEDILDEGKTLATLRNRVEAFDPASVRIASMFDSNVDRELDIDPKYTGFSIPDAFYVGYGLDYDERFRDLPHLAVLDPAIVDE